MSYCRISCDDFKSDVYVWHDVGGFWAILVAQERYRRKNGKPLLNEETVLVPGLYAGKMFQCLTRETCILKLKMLRNAGYYIPEHAIQRLRKEILEIKRFHNVKNKRKKST